MDPITSVPFILGKKDRIATAGSCFAQHTSRTLVAEGYNYLVTEDAPRTAGALDEGYGLFPARFANVYTTTQLQQLFDRANGLREPLDDVWAGRRGGFVDPFRPRIQEGGFASAEDALADRDAHLAAVREMFEKSDVFIFTLGLTEAWRRKEDGFVFPLAPGVVADVDESAYEFVNYDVATVMADLVAVIQKMREINPELKIILTVSPVPLIATYEDRHVLVSTTLSKSVLRVVADMVSREFEDVAYFPSYEMITGAYRRAEFYAEDLREIRLAGVAHVMSTFKRHYLGMATARTGRPDRPREQKPAKVFDEAVSMRNLQKVICDEEAIEGTI